MPTRKKLSPGDVLEFPIDGVKKSVQYLGNHTEYGGAIWVPSDDFRKGYVAFYPASAAVYQGVVKVTERRDPEAQVPTNIRRPGARARDGMITSWVIESQGEEHMTRELSDAEVKLPIAVIWNHEMLCIRIREGWNPTKEAGGCQTKKH